MILTVCVTASVAAVVTVCVTWVFKHVTKQVLDTFASAQSQWAAERRNMHAEWHQEREGLLERIQRPEQRPVDPEVQVQPLTAEQEDDFSFQVGQIVWDDKYLSEDPEELEVS